MNSITDTLDTLNMVASTSRTSSGQDSAGGQVSGPEVTFPKLDTTRYPTWNYKVTRILKSLGMEELIMMEFDEVLKMRVKWHEASEKEKRKGMEAYWTSNAGIGQAYSLVRAVKETARRETAARTKALCDAALSATTETTSTFTLLMALKTLYLETDLVSQSRAQQ